VDQLLKIRAASRLYKPVGSGEILSTEWLVESGSATVLAGPFLTHVTNLRSTSRISFSFRHEI